MMNVINEYFKFVKDSLLTSFQEKKTSIDLLPIEIVCEICSFLDLKSLGSASLVSKLWYEVTQKELEGRENLLNLEKQELFVRACIAQKCFNKSLNYRFKFQWLFSKSYLDQALECAVAKENFKLIDKIFSIYHQEYRDHDEKQLFIFNLCRLSNSYKKSLFSIFEKWLRIQKKTCEITYHFTFIHLYLKLLEVKSKQEILSLKNISNKNCCLYSILTIENIERYLWESRRSKRELSFLSYYLFHTNHSDFELRRLFELIVDLDIFFPEQLWIEVRKKFTKVDRALIILLQSLYKNKNIEENLLPNFLSEKEKNEYCVRAMNLLLSQIFTQSDFNHRYPLLEILLNQCDTELKSLFIEKLVLSIFVYHITIEAKSLFRVLSKHCAKFSEDSKKMFYFHIMNIILSGMNCKSDFNYSYPFLKILLKKCDIELKSIFIEKLFLKRFRKHLKLDNEQAEWLSQLLLEISAFSCEEKQVEQVEND